MGIAPADTGPSGAPCTTRMVRVMPFLVAVCVGPIVLIAVLGAEGWFAFAFSGANPFTYVPCTREREVESLARGDTICAALERCKALSGQHPASLDALVPVYLDRIDPPTLGDRRWRYERHANGGYTLTLWIGPDYESASRLHGSRQWLINR